MTFEINNLLGLLSQYVLRLAYGPHDHRSMYFDYYLCLMNYISLKPCLSICCTGRLRYLWIPTCTKSHTSAYQD